MAEHVVRQADAGDVTALARLHRAWYLEGHDEQSDVDPLFERRFRAWFTEESSRRVVWLAAVAGRPVGFVDLAILVRPPSPGHAAVRWGYLDSAFVLKPYRNQGIGMALVNAVLDYACNRDIARVLLYPTPKSVPFYQRAAFEILPADPKIRMVRAIARQPARLSGGDAAGGECGS
jgi:GNAT superfamily N-acetyltransferase